MRASGKRIVESDALSLASFRLTLSFAICMTLLIAVGRSVARVESVRTTSATPLARWSESISVHAAGRGNPSFNLSDGRDVLTSYSGPAELTQALQRNEAEPLALASADFDEDGVPDLICAYSHSSSGIITWLRGNVDSIYQNSPEAQQRKAAGEFTEAPFLSPARVFGLPIEPEFIGAGDFDGDGHRDVVAASQTSNALYLLRGDGRGGFGEATSVALPGTVTALVTGEINRPDGLTDVVVAINGQDGPRALVFEGPEGALRASPEVFALPAEASSLALGQLEGDLMTDLAIAAGNQLLFVQGRDRKLSLSKRSRAEVTSAVITSRDFPYTLRALAIDHFTSNDTTELAMLSDDGSLSLLRTARAGSKKATIGAWSSRIEVIDRKTWSESTKLVTARTSPMNVSSLLIVDSKSNQIDVVTCNLESYAQKPNKKAPPRTDPVVKMRLDMDDGPIAALPLRLNADALNDLIILRRGQSVPAVIETAAAAIYTVTNLNDSGDGSFRKAIDDSNMNPGHDAIRFNISPGQPPFEIALSTALPTVSDPVTIDGATQPGFTGTNVIHVRRGPLVITAGNSVVRGIDFIPQGGGGGIDLQSNGNNVIEGNSVLINGGTPDIFIDNSGNNLIGGVVPGSGNTLTSRFQGAGIIVSGSGNKIQGNTVGSDVGHSISIQQGTGNLIGGDVAGAGNVIGSGFSAAVGIETDLNVIQGNSITRSRAGILVSGQNNTIGGTVGPARNLITDNGLGDILLSGDGNLVQGNLIGTDASGTNGGQNGAGVGESVGVDVSASRNAVGGAVEGARNIISAHRGNFRKAAGVAISSGTDNEVVGNFIGTDITGTRALANTVGVQLLGQSLRSLVEGNVISGNNPQGIFIAGAIGALVQNNLIGAAADGVQPLGNEDGVVVTQSSQTRIEGNVISGNLQYGLVLGNVAGALVRNNLIGTAADGVRALGNAQTGVVATRAPETMIQGNVISSNGEHGISIGGILSILGVAPSGESIFGGTGTTVIGNRIGTDIEGIHPLGNRLDGVFVENQSQSHTIEKNIIAFNNRNGICVPNHPSNPAIITTEDPAVRILISENSMFSNVALGIDLAEPDVTNNDDKDPDGGANTTQNFPVLTSSTTDLSNTTVQGTFNSNPNQTFTIEFFSNPGDESSGVQALAIGPCVPQGQIFIGSITVTTDGKGTVPISIAFPSGNPGGFINATATSLAGNTSEFSACVQPKFLNADISVEQTAVASVAPGSNLSYQVTVANNGPDLAPNVVLVSRIPDNTTFDSFTAPGGWSSRVPDRGGTGALTSGVAGLFPGTSATFTIVLNVNSKAEDGSIIARSATVSSVIPDLAPGNNTRTSNTVVSAGTSTIPPDVAADVSISLSGPIKSVFEGDAITYVLTVTNNGPAAAKEIVVRQAAPDSTTFASSTKPIGWSSDCPAADGTSDIKFCTASLALNASASFTITITVNADTEAQTRIEATATVTSKSDPNSDNNSANVTLTTEARPAGPSITSIEVGETINARGAGFSKNLAVFIDSVGFKEGAKVKGGTRVIQKGKLTDGRSIAEAVPPGKVVKMKFRNSNGGETEVSFRR